MRWLLVVAAVALGGCTFQSGAPGQAQSTSRYTMVADEQGGVWRMDTQYGTLDRCTVGSDTQVHCVRASR
jgi:hypothetical protein